MTGRSVQWANRFFFVMSHIYSSQLKLKATFFFHLEIFKKQTLCEIDFFFIY